MRLNRSGAFFYLKFFSLNNNLCSNPEQSFYKGSKDI